MIHTTKERLWYVDYIQLSMIEQGISLDDIAVYIDSGDGCLKSYLQSFKNIENAWYRYGAIWHLQDDIILSRRFKELTEKYNEPLDSIVCGICPTGIEEGNNNFGHVSVDYMWYSFPCIKIPNYIAIEFVEWCESLTDSKHKSWIDKNKYVDSLFRDYILEKQRYTPVINLKPNIVDHVDYLLGGSTINSARRLPIRARYFEDVDLIVELEKKINANK